MTPDVAPFTVTILVSVCKVVVDPSKNLMIQVEFLKFGHQARPLVVGEKAYRHTTSQDYMRRCQNSKTNHDG